jgi:ribonuclease Y
MGPVIVGLAAGLAVAAIAGVVIYILQQKTFTEKKAEIEARRAEVMKVTAESEAHAKEIILKAKDDALNMRDQAEAENKRHRTELQREEERLRQRREATDRRLEQVENRDRKLEQKEKELDRARANLVEIEQKKLAEVQRVSGLTVEEAKQLLLQLVEKDTRQDAARIIREIETQAREEGERRAR